MKNLLLLFCCVLLMLTSSAGAQGPLAATSDSYRFGSRIVRIPAPAGFTDVVPRFDRITGRFTASESPDNEVVAVHVPDAIVPRLQKGEEPDLDFYTKVSVGKRVKTVDVTPEDFGLVIAGFEKEFDTLLDPKGPLLTGVVKNMQKGLTEHWGQDPRVDLNQPKSLGFFDKQPNVFSAMMLMNVEAFGKKFPLLCSISFVNVNNRLVFVYGYRRLTSDKDAEILRDFTKKWTTDIIAANKIISARNKTAEAGSLAPPKP